MDIQEMQARRKELGYTYRMLSDLANIPLPTVQKVLGGFTKSPRYGTMQALEKVLAPDPLQKHPQHMPEVSLTANPYTIQMNPTTWMVTAY